MHELGDKTHWHEPTGINRAGTGQFGESIQIRGPRGLNAAVRTLARRKHSTASEVVRQIVIRGLEAEGVKIPVEAAE